MKQVFNTVNYTIDKNGIVYKNNIPIKLSINNDGYYVVNLKIDNKYKTYNVHRLVALHFIPNPYNLPIVNHKDENKLNNNVDNLEWCDYEYSVNYGTRGKRSGENMKNSKQRSKPILQYTKDLVFIKEFPSSNEIQRELGYLQSNILKCCKGKYKQAYGYIWKYKNI